VHRALGLSQRESAEIVEGLLEEITATLARGEEVKIARFGSFSAHQKGPRVGRNPKTGQEVPITPRRVARFHASPALRAAVNAESLEQQDKAD
ncbi:MAG: integration host factor subunit alpha, partial [Alphaproteobacteria bacterium]|nr:integration host factor subunit alpha [Alphaproteobacteria bacterium]